MTRAEAIKILMGYSHTPQERAALEVLIPELTESEDERIIQNLIDAFTEYKKSGGVDFHGIEINTLLAWLEKQKEQFESGRGLYYYDGEKTTYMGYPATEENPYDFAISQQEKQKEQKPAEWSDTKELIFRDICNHLKEEGYGGWVVLLKALHNGEFQPKQQWSEEDKHRRDGIIQWLREYQKEFNPKYDSLSIESIESLIDWLKSLRPSWKPSEEQMKALKNSAYGTYQNGDGPALRELYQQLKKL